MNWIVILKAWVLSGGVFIFCAIGAVLLWQRDFFAVVDSRLVLALAVFCVALIARMIYQAYLGSFIIGNEGEAVTTKGMLRSLEDLFLKIYKNSPVPYVLVDRKGVVVSTNIAAVRLFNTTDGALTGKSLFDYLMSDENEQRISLFPGKFKQGLFINDQEVNIRREDGELRWVLFSLFSFTDSAGQRRGMATLVDVTKQKEIDKAKTEFVSLASHQLRTPLAAIKWNVELLLMKFRDSLPAQALSYVEAVSASAQRMEALVADFLNASRFELGTLTAEMTSIEVVPFLDGLCAEHAVSAQTKNIHLSKTYDERVSTMVSDTHLLGMAVGNLLSNAIKYTPEGGTVSLSVGRSSEGTVIAVTDTGMGIPAAEQDRVFSKIFRASNAQTHVPDGTGLGLYIAHEGVKVLGGTLTFVSEENKGTTFTITVPQNG